MKENKCKNNIIIALIVKMLFYCILFPVLVPGWITILYIMYVINSLIFFAYYLYIDG